MRLALLQEQLQKSGSISENKQQQADDQAATLDLTVSSMVESTMLDSARAEIKRLEHNLLRLDSEDAGVCEQCGCDIPLPRLNAVPDTRLCVTCADTQ